jgi:hypothetical protein
MDKDTWNAILILAVPVVLGLSILTLVLVRPRRQVLLPFLPTLAASIAVYSSRVHGAHGANEFHRCVSLCTLLALGYAVFLVAAQPWRNRLAAFSWALLGVVTPYTAFISLIVVACWGQTECLG